MSTEAKSSLTKRLPRHRLWFAGAGVAGIAVVAGWMMLNTNPGKALMRPPALVETDGAFRPSDSQWSGFRLAKVESVAFREERTTDGRIAINEDTTTPVFSPYSGRVSRLIAKPGEHVERGAPLFAIEASEFVQGHNDLITAAAGVDKAKSRLALAQMAEKRQRDLQAIRGGALKDLEQAQSDLVQAQGDLRAAEITLAAVRNRLRILGRSDIAVPIAIAVILLLLYVSFGSLTDTLIAGSAIPMALTGGIFGLFLADMPFSISAAIGFVALFGIAAMNGIMVVGCYNRLIESGMERARALSETCDQQMRPVLMTCVAACVGLIPAAFSTAIGSQVQRPLAVVVVGGTLLAPVLILTVLPAALSIFSRRIPEMPTASEVATA